MYFSFIFILTLRSFECNNKKRRSILLLLVVVVVAVVVVVVVAVAVVVVVVVVVVAVAVVVVVVENQYCSMLFNWTAGITMINQFEETNIKLMTRHVVHEMNDLCIMKF